MRQQSIRERHQHSTNKENLMRESYFLKLRALKFSSSREHFNGCQPFDVTKETLTFCFRLDFHLINTLQKTTMSATASSLHSIECSDQPLDLSFHPQRDTLVAAALVDGTLEGMSERTFCVFFFFPCFYAKLTNHTLQFTTFKVYYLKKMVQNRKQWTTHRTMTMKTTLFYLPPNSTLN